jgi:hypothetical protein
MTDDPQAAAQPVPRPKRRRNVDNTTPGRSRNQVEDGLTHVVALAEQAGHIEDITWDSGWRLLPPWIPGTERPQPVPGLKCLLLQGLEGKNTMWPLSHGLKLLAKFYEAVCETQDLDEDDDDDCNDAWLMDTCDNGDEEDEDFVQPFYYDGPPNMGWLSDCEGPLFLLIDFNRRFVLMADESLCLLKRSWSGREYVDNVIKSPLEGYADVRVRDQSTSFILWWEDYIEGGRASVVSIGGLS